MSLIELLSGAHGAVQPQGNKIWGVVVGIVQDIRDPAGMGRVKVRFPWLAEKQDETVYIDAKEARAHSFWARIATLMAGQQRGAFFVPEVGEEVLVAFEHGELDRPIVLGGLWNKQDPPPLAVDNAGKNDIRAIHTRSGHKVVFNDSQNAPSIEIVDKNGNRIFIDSKKNNMEIKVKGDLTIDVGGNISISAGREIAIKANSNVKIQAQGNGDVNATGPLTIKSGARVSIDGTGQAELKAAKVGVNGSALTEILGGLVKIN